MTDYQVGQRVYYVDGDKRYQHRNGFRTIASIGRKWAKLDGGHHQDKFNIKTGRLDGGEYTSPGRVYLSQEEFETRSEFKSLIRRLGYSHPENIKTVEQVREIEKMIFGP